MRSGTARNAVLGLHALGDLLGIVNEHPERVAPLRPFIEPHVWHSIVSWLDFLHPVHHVNTPRMKHVPLSAIAGAFYALFSVKPALRDLFDQTPHVHQLAFDLLLRVDDHCVVSEALAREDNFYLLFGVLKPALLLSDGPAQIIPMRLVPDPRASDVILPMVGGSLRRLPRCCLRMVRLLVDACPPGTDISMTTRSTVGSAAMPMNQLTVIAIFISPFLPVPCQARDVVRDLVELLSAFLTRQALEAASVTCQALFGIWHRASDRRSLVWALKDGALRLFLVLYRVYPTSAMDNILRWIAHRAPGDQGLRVCQVHDLGPAQIRRAAISVVRKDWKMHKPRSRSIEATMQDASCGYLTAVDLTPLDMRFQPLCTRAYIRSHLSHLRADLPPTNTVDYHMLVNFTTSPTSHALAPQTKRRSEKEPFLLVTAHIRGWGQAYASTLKACIAPVRYVLDGYVPVVDKWAKPGGQWRGDVVGLW
ncbi:hypothetical protein BD626DRAFT_635164 [Schizophyllum amplum]|uniref:Uncharacterized protein n=1 Tax=Schizophyllum amplum TaxID=97359 RepID=A0A550BX21_9AGAR|nr:hypothetical protein BD626DRAFT_635164 [Auriculariopsis ampla]